MNIIPTDKFYKVMHVSYVGTGGGGGGGGGGSLVENVSFVSPACCKRHLNGVVSRNNRIKRFAPCRCLDGHVKEPYEMFMAFGARQ